MLQKLVGSFTNHPALRGRQMNFICQRADSDPISSTSTVKGAGTAFGKNLLTYNVAQWEACKENSYQYYTCRTSLQETGHLQALI